MTEHATAETPTISVLDVDQAVGDGGGVPLFAVTFRGYDRYEVEHHLAELDARITSLAADRDASAQELMEIRAELAAANSKEAVAGYPTYKAMGERIAELFAAVELEAAAVRGRAGAELDRAQRDAERIAVAAADDRQAMLEDARESVRQMKAEAQREIAEFDSQVAQARARAENAAAAQLAELDRRLEAREHAAKERLEAREATARQRLTEVTREYEDVSGRLRQIAAQISVVDEVPVGELPPSHTAMTEVFPPAAPPRQPEELAADAFDQWTPAPFNQENED
jgi:cell division septum initiation protein DivIVA